MNIKFSRILSRLLLVLMVAGFSVTITEGQQLPYTPFSYRFFSPFILNPAMAGSKDYTSLNLIASFGENGGAQLLSGDGRLTKPAPEYVYSGTTRDFRNFGVGGYAFNNLKAGKWNAGAAASGAYHFPLNSKGLSFLSLGAAYKGMYSRLDNQFAGDTTLSPTPGNLFCHNLDLGMYYYGPEFYAGLSATNILENHISSPELQQFGISKSRQYYIIAGYKFLLHKALNIVFEPSFIITVSDTSFIEEVGTIQPTLKLYLMDFCLGAHYDNTDNFSFFFQYRYPRFYLGAYFELPRRSAYYIKEPSIEITAGVNLSQKKGRVGRFARW